MNWYIAHNGQSLGPYTTQQMQGMASARQITPDMQVCDAAGGQWVAAGTLGWLFAQVPAVAGYTAPTTEVFNPSPMLAQAMISAVSRPHTTHVHVERPHGNSLGTTSLVLGIVAFMFCWIPFIGFLTVPVAAFALLLGVVGCFVAMSRGGSGIGTSLGGMFLSSMVLVLYAIFVAAIGAAVVAVNETAIDAQSASRDSSTTQDPTRKHPFDRTDDLMMPQQIPSWLEPLPDEPVDVSEQVRKQITASRDSTTAPKIYQLREWTFTNREPLKGKLRKYGPVKTQIEDEASMLHDVDTAALSKESKDFIATNLN